MEPDPFHLHRFVEAQEPEIASVLSELRRGEKSTHWMWFIFPQIRGLGRTSTANFYAIASLDEARAYLDHPVLGTRLRTCTQLVLDVQGRSLNRILGSPDDLKFRSSMTLFAHATADNGMFVAALDKYCGGELDPRTVERL